MGGCEFFIHQCNIWQSIWVHFVNLQADEANNAIHVKDTGVGMRKRDLIKNFGKIPKPGLSKFLEKLQAAETTAEINEILDEFGGGFYSAFLGESSC